MNEKEIESLYPNAYEWLLETKEDHLKKDSGGTKDGAWYRYARKQGISRVEIPKLFLMEICSSHPNVTLNNTNYYHPTTVYSWELKQNVSEPYELFLAIANSDLMWWFLKMTGDTLQGDARRLKTNYLNPFPLPDLPDSSEVYQIVELVKNIIPETSIERRQELKG